MPADEQAQLDRLRDALADAMAVIYGEGMLYAYDEIVERYSLTESELEEPRDAT